MSGEINDTVIIFSFVRSQAEKKSRFWTFFLITQEFSYNLLHNCVLIGCDLFLFRYFLERICWFSHKTVESRLIGLPIESNFSFASEIKCPEAPTTQTN